MPTIGPRRTCREWQSRTAINRSSRTDGRQRRDTLSLAMRLFLLSLEIDASVCTDDESQLLWIRLKV